MKKSPAMISCRAFNKSYLCYQASLSSALCFFLFRITTGTTKSRIIMMPIIADPRLIMIILIIINNLITNYIFVSSMNYGRTKPLLYGRIKRNYQK